MEYIQLELDIGRKHEVELKFFWTVRCIDINTLLERIYNPQGNIDVSLLHFKLGLDFGRGFLKLIISERLVNSVNDVYYLWVAQVPESYHNFRVIFDHGQMRLLLSEYNVSLTVDLKAASIATGVMLGRYPCIWCNWSVNDNFNENDTAYTIRNNAHHMEMWNRLQVKYKGNWKTYSKECDGIENLPVVDKWVDNSMQIWNIPELHLLLGVGQKLYDNVLLKMSVDEQNQHKELLKKYGIITSDYHGNAFEGNAMSKLLKNIPNLGMNPNNICVIALKRFSDVVEACFRTEVSENYSQAILLFEEAYKSTGLSCTVKVHCLCRHVRTFIEDFLPKGAGLGAVSEQAFESSHSRFKRVWERQYKCNQYSPLYAKNLYLTVCELMYCNYMASHFSCAAT